MYSAGGNSLREESSISVPQPAPTGGIANPSSIGIGLVRTELYLSRKLTKISCLKQLGIFISR